MITKRQILSLIMLAIIMAIVSVACKKKPTDVGNLSVVEEAEQTPAPEFPSDSPNNKLNIDTNQGLIQFKGLSFKSGAYYLNGERRKKIYYYADVKVDENSKPYISAITKSEDGEIIEDEGKFYDNENGKGAVYNLEGVRYKSNNRNTAAVTFTEDGYLIIKFSNYGADITYSLTEKINEEEIDRDTLIPSNWWGEYDGISGSYAYVNHATVYSNRVTYSGTYYISNYIGKNTWYCGNQSIYKNIYNEFLSNEKGQRIFYEILEDRQYTNIFVNIEDKDK